MAATTELDVIPATGNPYLDTLIVGGRYINGPVTYYFDDGGANGAADDWPEWARDMMRDVFDTFSDYIQLDFQEVNSAAAANFRLRLQTGEELEGAAGRFGYPDADGQVYGSLNYEWERFTEELGQKGGYLYHTALHEVGHGLGLGHPHGSGGLNGSPFPGVDGPGNSGDHGLNNGIYTVMSYLDHSQFWAPTPASSDYGWGFAGTPMAFDVWALQEIYGARVQNAGNTIYDLPDVNGDGTYWQSIHDSGGTDLIRYTGNMDAVIDLRPAAYGEGEGAGGYLSNVVGVAGGYTIGHGSGFFPTNRIENGSGGSGDDTIRGNDADNVLHGNGGRDSLEGGNGEDTLLGGSGNDTLDGGGLDNDLHGGPGSDLYRVGWQDQVFEATNAGNDTVQTGLDHALTANVENLYLLGTGNTDGTGNSLDNRIDGSAGDNVLEGLGGEDTINGHFGDDTIDGGTGSDSLTGGNGDDLIDGGEDAQIELGIAMAAAQPGGKLSTSPGRSSGPPAIDPVYTDGDGDGGGGGQAAFGYADTLRGGNGEDTLIGRGGNDRLFGDFNDDSLEGGSGRDTLNGGHGNDTMVGGTSSDLYYVDAAGDVVVEGVGGGIADEVLASVDHVLSANVEDLSLTGTGDINGTGNELDNRILGTSGENVLVGEAGDDFLSAGDGDDDVFGNAGDDTLMGGNGDDTARGGSGADSVSGGAGEDLLKGGGGGDTVRGGGDDDTVSGNGGADDVRGDDGNDRVKGGAGDDSLFGGHGDDTLKGGGGEDWMFGGNGNDSLVGGGATDALFGGAGSDTLKGGDGLDFLTGGIGDDRLTGGGGPDAFLFDGRFGVDTITDFSEGDQLWFAGYGNDPDTLEELLDRTTVADGDTTIDLTDLSGGVVILAGFDEPLTAIDVAFFP